MTTPTSCLSWFPFLFVCGIALLISCSDHTGPDQSTMEITRISPDSGAVGTRVTIYSNSIDPEHAKNQVEINGTPVPILSFASNSLVVEVPEGISSGPVTLQVNGKVANGPYFKVLTEGPVIEGVTPARGGPGTPVTITGHHFLPPSMMAKISGDSTARGATSATDDSLQSEVPKVTLKAKGQPSPTINGLPVAVSFGDQLAPLLSLSATQIIAEVPGEATSGVITLTVDGQTATNSDFRLMLPPVISEVAPTAGPVGTAVTITGHYFAPHPDSNQVTFNGIRAEITEADTARLMATVPEGASTGLIELTTRGQATTGPTFTLSEAPVPQLSISDMSPKTGPVGTEVTITGANFSATAAENTVRFNGTEATVSSASTTELVATVPEGATTGAVAVTVGDQTATGPTFTVTEAPVPQVTISDISPKQGTVGTSVTITGQNFSPTAAENTVTFNGTEATVSSASATELVVSVPDGATTGAVAVTVGNQTADGPTFTVTEAPVPEVTISDISPKEGPVGTSVTITGQNFSATAAENTVTFNGTEASLQSASETQLVATVPEGATNGPVNVTTNGQTATGPSFTVTADPNKELTINDISPKQGPAGTSVMISGANFSATAAENTVTFNGTEATVSNASTTELVVTVPQGASTGSVKVQVGNQTADGPTFTVTEAPVPQVTIDDISPKQGPVGTEVTINGANFSATAAENTVTFNGTEATVSSASATELVVSVPDDATSGPVQVTVGAQTATGPSFSVTVNEAPTITGEASFAVEENTTAVATITADDPDGDALAFSISGGADQEQFSIGEASGELAFTAAPDFDNPADTDGDNTYELEVQVSDGALSVTKAITVSVTNVNEAPAITGEASVEVDENTTAVAAITADDPEGDALTFALSGGADQDAFSIGENSGELAFTTAPDFEDPADTGGDNTYEVEVQVSDPGGLSATQAMTVAVQGVNDNPPAITSPASFEVEENTIEVGTITATDPEGDALTFSLAGGNDQSQFSIDENSGELTFATTPDFEVPKDRDRDNTYEVVVQVSDGSPSADQPVSVAVQNVAEAPVFYRGRITTNAGDNYYAQDPDFTFNPVPAGTRLIEGDGVLRFFVSMYDDVDPITSATMGGPDAATFSIEFTDAYEIHLSGPTLAYSESPYEFTVTAENAAGQTTTQTFTIPVLQPAFFLADNGVTIRCPEAEVGDTGVVNGETYTKRNNQITPENAATTCTSGITDMSDMFQNASSFNGDLSGWDVSSVTDMRGMFWGTAFNGDISDWDVSSVTNMRDMFYRASSFNGDLSGWDVSSVTDMGAMFWGTAFNGDISDWDVSSVTNMRDMFFSASSFNGDLSGWDVSSVTDMGGMFYSASSFNQDLSGWCVPTITSEPTDFDTGAGFEGNSGFQPQWGTCPQ